MQNFNGNPDSTYYVYIYVSYPDNQVFYVGKGQGNRWTAAESRTSYFKEAQREIEEKGGKILPVKIWFTDDEQEAYDMERYFYDMYTSLGHGLCNRERPKQNAGKKFNVVRVPLPENVQQKLDEIYEDWTAKNGVEPSLRQIVIKLIMDYKIKNRP
jgi:hypothetical protein